MLLDKFEFIPPENHTGFTPADGAISVIRKANFKYVDLGTIIGDAPKCMIALYEYEKSSSIRKKNPCTWRKYIAKSASKWYPNESITEHLLNELGRTLKLNVANSCIKRINNQVWFLSEYFLKEDQQLIHGADIFTSHYDNNRELVDQIQDDNKIDDQEFFTIQMVEKSLERHYPEQHSELFQSFIKMILFDGIVGNNDRHSYNWGIIQGVKSNAPVRFSPIYDTARGLYWNLSENNVKKILALTDKNGKNCKIEKYVVNSRPKIGWEGHKPLNHFELLKQIYVNQVGISKENFVNYVSQDNLNDCLNVINNDFKRLYTQERRILITQCISLRFKIINEFINKL